MKRRSTFTANGELTLSRRVVQQIVEARLQEGELQRREQQKVAARRQQQIAAAVAVLAPKLKTEKDHARCRAKIGKVLDTIDASVAFDDAFREWRGSAVSKRAVRAYIKVLRRAAVAHKQLPRQLQRGFIKLNFQAAITDAEHWLAVMKDSRSLLPTRQFIAVVWASRLLEQHGLPVTRWRRSHWHRLAAILYGSENYDLYRYMHRPRIGKK